MCLLSWRKFLFTGDQSRTAAIALNFKFLCYYIFGKENCYSVVINRF